VPKENVLFASGVKRRTNMILRAFAADNDLTRSELMDILAHIVSGYSTIRLFREPIGGDYDPAFAKLDAALREYVEKNFPEWYRTRPILNRLFGNLFKPISKSRLEAIDKALAEEESPPPEVPDVEDEDIE